MTQEEAERIQDMCDDVIEEIRNSDHPTRANWTVNWADLSCRDVLVSALHPNNPPTLKIEEADPGAWGFAEAVEVAMEERGVRCIVETEW